MIYGAVSHIGIKMNQDASGYSELEGWRYLILADGIGSFEDSGEISKILVQEISSKGITKGNEAAFLEEISKGFREISQNGSGNSKEAGTTMLIASWKSDNLESDSILFRYLGNGGITHLPGDFSETISSNLPYRYVDLLLPHVAANTALTRCVTEDSTEEVLKPGMISLSLTHPEGDVLLFYTDGITSKEEQLIVKDDQGRVWRNESSLLLNIIERLHQFLMTETTEVDFETQLKNFIEHTLNELKDEFEDDAGLGIVISQKVLDYYDRKIGENT